MWRPRISAANGSSSSAAIVSSTARISSSWRAATVVTRYPVVPNFNNAREIRRIPSAPSAITSSPPLPWKCVSMQPGMTTRPLASMIREPGSGSIAPDEPTALIWLSSQSATPFSITSSRVTILPPTIAKRFIIVEYSTAGKFRSIATRNRDLHNPLKIDRWQFRRARFAGHFELAAESHLRIARFQHAIVDVHHHTAPTVQLEIEAHFYGAVRPGDFHVADHLAVHCLIEFGCPAGRALFDGDQPGFYLPVYFQRRRAR